MSIRIDIAREVCRQEEHPPVRGLGRPCEREQQLQRAS